MNIFDSQIISFVNQFSQHSWMFDKLVVHLEKNNLLKGGVLSTIIWWAWFKKEECSCNNRKHVISTLVSCIIAIIFGRIIALALPFRPRPMHEEALHLVLPFGMTSGWESLSAFPSDHAVLFFALATGLLFISKWLGTFALFYALLFIGFPRVYLGLHYPSDIIAGAVIGISIALAGNIYLIKSTLVKSIIDWSNSKPSIFYPLFFLVTYQIADLFNHSWSLFSSAIKVIAHIIA
jgi:undecaprenyl-diphosphatase